MSIVTGLPRSTANRRWAYARAEYRNAEGQRRVLIWQVHMDSGGRRGEMALRENLGADNIPGTQVNLSGDELLEVLGRLEESGRIVHAGDEIVFLDDLRGEFVARCRARMKDAQRAPTGPMTTPV